MFEVSVKTHFSGAHYLRGYPGVCRNPHGHNWEVEVFLRGTHTDEIGMLADFKGIKTAVQEVLGELDHQDLNRLPPFAEHNPTSEHLAQYVYRALAQRFDHARYRVHRVWVSETPGSSAAYWEE